MKDDLLKDKIFVWNLRGFVEHSIGCTLLHTEPPEKEDARSVLTL